MTATEMRVSDVGVISNHPDRVDMNNPERHMLPEDPAMVIDALGSLREMMHDNQGVERYTRPYHGGKGLKGQTETMVYTSGGIRVEVATAYSDTSDPDSVCDGYMECYLNYGTETCESLGRIHVTTGVLEPHVNFTVTGPHSEDTHPSVNANPDTAGAVVESYSLINFVMTFVRNPEL